MLALQLIPSPLRVAARAGTASEIGVYVVGICVPDWVFGGMRFKSTGRGFVGRAAGEPGRNGRVGALFLDVQPGDNGRSDEEEAVRS